MPSKKGIELVTEASDRAQLQIVFNLLESPLFNRLTVGKMQAFSDMSLIARTKTLRSWGNSDIAPARQVFQSLKRLALFIFYAAMPTNEPNPTWASLHYPDHAPHTEPAPKPIKPLEITAPTTLYTDVLVIGSGAGGGVVAE